MSDDPKRIVERGYDTIADRFGAWQKEISGSPHLAWVEDLVGRLGPESDVLELGSGAAVEPTRLLAQRARLVGVDISAEQVRRARERCPEGTFLQADMTEVEFADRSFDAVVSAYAFNHVPRNDLAALLPRVGRWLRPSGYLLASFGASGGEGVEEDWLGVPMFFASFTADENRQLVEDAGLEIVRDEIVPMLEPEGEVRFHWILAQRAPQEGLAT
jgi:ubiquinone/menaquinone biosynthesis C-methylase UbiE